MRTQSAAQTEQKLLSHKVEGKTLPASGTAQRGRNVGFTREGRVCVPEEPGALTQIQLSQVRESARCTHRKQHDGHGQRDGGQNGEAHQQQQGVKFVDLGEGVEQLCFHSTCGAQKGEH